MNATVSLARRAAALLLLASACGAPKDSPPRDASVGGVGSSDQAVDEPSDLAGGVTPRDAGGQGVRDMAHGQAPVDMAKGQAPVDMAKKPPPPPRDVTFYVVADTHADPPTDSYDLRAQARAINAVAQNAPQWPSSIGGTSTGFAGGKIAPPVGVVFVGDLTGWGTAPTEIATFRHYFEKGNSGDSINYPAYLGLGNHDIDTADRSADLANQYRATYWAWIDSRHKGSGAPVPAGNFDAASHAYSFDFSGVHLVQVHRFAGDTGYGLPSALPWVKSDLASHAADGRPVFFFHHYGMDAFGTNGQWWNQGDRDAYRAALKGYNVAGIFVGHSHAAFNYTWADDANLRVFQVNNAKAENGTGNNDGNGSFAIVRITDNKLDVVTCRWTDDQGHYELIAPWFSGAPTIGPARMSPPSSAAPTFHGE